MARGRKSSPAQTNVLKGNFRKDRHDHGPQVDIGLPPCPKWLPREAKKHWDALGQELVSVGLLSIVDGDVFALHCDTMAKFEQVTIKLKKLEDMLDSTPQGYQVQSALFTIRSKLHEQVVKTAREFGLTPAGRTSLKTSGQQQLSLGGDGWDTV